MDVIESLILLAACVAVIAAIAMLTPRVGNGVAAIVGLMRRRRPRLRPTA